MNYIQLEYWKNLRHFKGNPDNIPELPKTDKETWNNLIVPKLIECGAIPKKDLIIGKKYMGSCRNSEHATWNGKYFEYERHKWGITYIDKINHFEDDDGFDLFIPIELENDGTI